MRQRLHRRLKGLLISFVFPCISKPESSHTVREEIAAINQYLDILKYKYGEGIQAEWILPPGMEEESINVLLLYPLVENAVFHGLSKVKDKHLVIKFEEDHEKKCISVSDNGVGMSKKRNLWYLQQV